MVQLAAQSSVPSTMWNELFCDLVAFKPWGDML